MAKKKPEETEIKVDKAAPIASKEMKQSDKKANLKSVKMTSQLETPAVLAEDSVSAPEKKAKKVKKQSDKPNIFQKMWKGIKGIVSELKKVTWPNAKGVAKSTAVVLVVVVAFFLILFGIDYVLSGILSLIVNGSWAFIFIS